MAIQVSGTEVISNARNISNVGTVTATSFVGDGAGLTGLSSAPFAPAFSPTATPDVTLTASGTWTKPAIAADSWVTFYMVSGGGGGTRDSGTWQNGGSGANAVIFSSLASSLPATITFTLGAAGAGGSANPSAGGNGGNTSFTVGGQTFTSIGGTGGLLTSTGAATSGVGVLKSAYSGVDPWFYGLESEVKGGSSPLASAGSTSVLGGGGGGSGLNATGNFAGGVSTYAGNGGQGGITSVAGGTPGGGGGGGVSSGGAGGAARVFIYYG